MNVQAIKDFRSKITLPSAADIFNSEWMHAGAASILSLILGSVVYLLVNRDIIPLLLGYMDMLPLIVLEVIAIPVYLALFAVSVIKLSAFVIHKKMASFPKAFMTTLPIMMAIFWLLYFVISR